jgi:intracellular sulfur oxidation DsrE/DsrF family protein
MEPVMKLTAVSSLARRSFLSRLGAAAAATGATFAASAPAAQAQTPPDGRWQPARHAQDDWFDQLPGKHRFFFDTTTPEALADAIQFTGNFYSANKSGYDLGNADLAVVVCMRHRSAPFAFNDAIWAKYGVTLAKRAEFTDPKTNEAPKANFYTPVAPASPARARGLANLMTLGVQFAICDLSTHGIAGMIAAATGGTSEAVYKELTANLIDKARLVPAGIVAVNRAQERGFSITGS